MLDCKLQELTMLNASVAKLFGYCVKCCADGAIDQQETLSENEVCAASLTAPEACM